MMAFFSETFLEDVEHSRLFDSVPEDVRPHLLECLNAHEINHRKGETVIRRLDSINDTLFLLEGTAYSVSFSTTGKRSILAVFEKGVLIPDTVRFLEPVTAMADIVAVNDCRFLSLTMNPSFLHCGRNAHHVAQVNRNIATEASKTFTAYVQHLHILSQRTIHGKISEYFDCLSDTHGTRSWHADLSRQDMADYLQVERTSLSHEMAKSSNARRQGRQGTP